MALQVGHKKGKTHKAQEKNQAHKVGHKGEKTRKAQEKQNNNRQKKSTRWGTRKTKTNKVTIEMQPFAVALQVGHKKKEKEKRKRKTT